MKKLFVIVLLFSLKASAQRISYSGNWRINKEKINWTVIGNFKVPEWTLPKGFVINQNASEIMFERIMLNGDLSEFKYTEILKYDGTSSEIITPNGTNRKSFLEWNSDKNTFIISSRGTVDKETTNIIENWSIEDEGKTLVINRHVEQSNGWKYDIKAYYDKTK